MFRMSNFLCQRVAHLILNPTDECVEWPHSKSRAGYGQVWFQGKMKRVHRVAYEVYHGEPPRNWVLHKCNNPSCFNPAHLYDGTHRQNASDRKWQLGGKKMKVIQIEDDASATIHELTEFMRSRAYCYACDQPATVAVDYSYLDIEPYRHYMCWIHLQETKFQERLDPIGVVEDTSAK